jgi:lincosamide nucleotidyltransferase A/C/D/E
LRIDNPLAGLDAVRHHVPVTPHLMTRESAEHILAALAAGGVDARVGGGWSVDALLQEQTREHSDLDLWLESQQIEPLFAAMAELGIDRIYPWPGDRPWNFVLHDGRLLRIDLHFYERIPQGLLHYGAVTSDETFPEQALAGHGVIGTTTVRCETPEWALHWHTGYPARPVDHHDIARLCARFQLAIPPSFS